MTDEVLEPNGWFHTGDVVEILPSGCVKIIDRKKNLFKLQQGEYIAPEKLENCYVKSPMIAQIFVHGDSLRTFIVAVATLDEALAKPWAESRGLSLEELPENEELRKEIMEDLNSRAKEAKFNGLEKIKKLYIHPEQFTVENKLLTPTLKLVRNEARKFFEEQIEAMYGE